MIAFEIYVNGRKLCTAGTDGLSTVTAGAGFILPKQPPGAEPVLHLTVGGASVKPARVVTWGQHKLRVGDEVTIRVVDTPEVEAPDTIHDLPSDSR
jgi:hypothetical protein